MTTAATPAPAPTPTDQYTRSWKTSGETKYIDLPNGARVRYIEAGEGQPLVLLHPLRGQLDYFERLIPLLLSDSYRVIAVDLPGFGYSSLPSGATPDEPFLRASVVAMMEALNLQSAVLLGESIGATLALTAAAEAPARIARVAAINPYDYGEQFGGGVRRSAAGRQIGLIRWLGTMAPAVRGQVRHLLASGMVDASRVPEGLVAEFEQVGRQPGYREREVAFYRAWRSWVLATEHYARVTVPVTLVYGDHDWSRPDERQARQQLLAKVSPCVLTGAGHFLSLERPEQIEALIGADLINS
jgi:pimeloyl-ACP methyl ester carboxylesterase